MIEILGRISGRANKCSVCLGHWSKYFQESFSQQVNLLPSGVLHCYKVYGAPRASWYVIDRNRMCRSHKCKNSRFLLLCEEASTFQVLSVQSIIS